MNRFKAATIHLGISVLVGLLVLLLMLGLWYPDGYFALLGGATLLYLILGVDVTLGPLLTLVVFNPTKKTLKFDLAVIGMLQFTALLYGANVLFQSRPVFNVLEEDVFKVTVASELEDESMASAKNPLWKKKSLVGPVLVAAVAPTNPEEQEKMVLAAAAGMDWNVFPEYYVSYDSQRKVALSHAKPLSNLNKISPEAKLKVMAFLVKHDRVEEDFVYLPIVAGYVAMTAVLDKVTADFIGIIDIDS